MKEEEENHELEDRHSAPITTYVAHNPQLRARYAMLPSTAHPRLMIMMGPFYGALREVVAGSFAAIAGKLMKRKEPHPSQEQKTP